MRVFGWIVLRYVVQQSCNGVCRAFLKFVTLETRDDLQHSNTCVAQWLNFGKASTITPLSRRAPSTIIPGLFPPTSLTGTLQKGLVEHDQDFAIPVQQICPDST